MKIEEMIRKTYGSNYSITLAHFGVEAGELIDKYQRLYDEGAYSSFPYDMLGKRPEEWAAQEACNEIKDLILTHWLAGVSREQILATLNTMAELPISPVLEYLPGEQVTVDMLMDAWNKAHQDEKKVQYNPDYLL